MNSSPRLSRRRLLGAGVAATATAAVCTLDATPAHAADDFDVLRQRWVDFLTGGSDLDVSHPAIADKLATLSQAATTALASAGPLSANSSIWADLPMAGPLEANISLTYSRILQIATAWATTGTAITQDAAVGKKLVDWYRHMSTYWYNLTIRKSGNWWFWEIGIPRTLGDLSALIDGLLTDADRAAAVAAIRRFTPNPNWRGTATSLAETGGNRADKVLACILRALAVRSTADMVLARDAMSDVVRGGANSLFRHVTSGNGFYADGSYVDHSYLPYVGTYGNVALSGIARSLLLLSNSPWQVTDPAVSVILDAPQKSFAPFIWNGRMLETVRGRAVSRQKERDVNDGLSTVSSLLLMAPGLADPHRSLYQSLAKGWLQRCTTDVTTVSNNLGDIARALRVLADASVSPASEPVGHVRTAAQERMVHRGNGWAFSVATSSSRIGRYEWGNNENNLGWHQGDGASYLMVTRDDAHYADDYWPTVDPYRLAGTTAALTPRSSGASGAGTGIPRAANAWGGGVALQQRWGSAGMDLTNSLGTVRAKKSWFVIDDLIVVVGSGVDAVGTEAETVVENRGLPAEAPSTLLLDGSAVTGEVEAVNPSWAHLSYGADVAGYVFLTPTALKASVQQRTGDWYAINSGADTSGSDTPITKGFASLRVVHPQGTTGGTYAHVIAPRFTAAQTAALAADLEVQIVRLDATAHVVRLTRKGNTFLFAHLFAASTTGPVQSSGPIAVLAQRHGNEASFAVASPSRNLTSADLVLDLGRPFRRVLSSDARLSVTGGKTITVSANLAVSGGASFEATLAG